MDSDSEDDLEEKFSAATSFVQSNVKSFDNSQLLKFYGFYKQSVVGTCNINKPSWYEMEAKEKWNSWHRLIGMDKSDAMKEYVNLLTSLKPDWEGVEGGSNETSCKSKQSWVSVSCMAREDDAIDSEDKTAFDWVKEGDVVNMRRTVDDSSLNNTDESGLGLIHWAADRGDAKVVSELLDMGPDIDLVDASGQTALHYASACGHDDVVSLLLQRGASPHIKDYEGQTPSDVALTQTIRTLITKYI